MKVSAIHCAPALLFAAVACSQGASDLHVGTTSSALIGQDGWMEVGGGGTSTVADSAVVFNDEVYLFGIGTGDHHHYLNSFDGATWSGWSAVPGTATTVVSDASAVLNGQLHLFGIDMATQHHVENITSDGRSWRGWQEIPGATTTNVADAAVSYNGALYLFSIQPNDHHYVNISSGSGTWGGWNEVPGGGTSVVSDGATVFNGSLYLFGIGTNDHNHYLNILSPSGAWTGWSGLPQAGVLPTVLPDAPVVYNDRLYEFSNRMTDKVQYVDTFFDGGWEGWTCVVTPKATNVGDAAVSFNGRLLLFTVGTDNHHYMTDATPCSPGLLRPLRYNEVRQRSSHNAYASLSTRTMSLFDQLAYHHIRSLELDVHSDRYGSEFGIGSDFWVYHEPTDDENPTCDHLSICLHELQAFHDSQPNHEVITLWIEPKNPTWASDHLPDLLDQDIRKWLPTSTFFTPADLLASCRGATTLREAVAQCGWPSIDALRGKFIVAVMETNAGDSEESTVAAYENRPNPLGFSAYRPERAPGGADDDPNVVMFNINFDLTQSPPDPPPPAAWYTAGFVTRACCATDPTKYAATWEAWEQYGIQHMGLDLINEDVYPQYDFPNEHQWPFQWPADPSLVYQNADDESVIRLVTSSGDIENEADSFDFAYLADDAVTTNWTASISASSGTENGWAKGCLMLREDTTPGSPYFAICRPAQGHPTRVQYRRTYGGGTSIQEFQLSPDVSATFAQVSTVGTVPNCYTGSASNNVNETDSTGTVCFQNALRLQGLAASSHGDASVKFVFGAVLHGQAAGNNFPASALTPTAIGAGAQVLGYGDQSR